MMIVHTCNISWLEATLCSHLCWTLNQGTMQSSRHVGLLVKPDRRLSVPGSRASDTT